MKSMANFYNGLLKDIEPTQNGPELKRLVEEANENQPETESVPEAKSTLAYKILTRLLKEHQQPKPLAHKTIDTTRN